MYMQAGAKKRLRIYSIILISCIIYKLIKARKAVHKCDPTSISIFSYQLPELEKLQLKLENSQFSTENIVHTQIRSSQFHTTVASKADFFFVQLYPMGVIYRYKKASEDLQNVLYDFVSDYIPTVNVPPCLDSTFDLKWCRRLEYQAGVLNYTRSLLKYWNMYDDNGKKHIFIFPGGDQQTMFPNWKMVIFNSIHLLVEGHYGEYYQQKEEKELQAIREVKDIIIPGGGDLNVMQNFPIVHKDIFLSYCGSTTSSVERKAIPLFLSQIMHKGVVKFKSKCTKSEFLEFLRRSKYCLTPAGSTPWTSRLYGALTQACVPVLFNVNTFIPPYRMIEVFNKAVVRLPISSGIDVAVEGLLANNYEESLHNLQGYSQIFHINFTCTHLIAELKKSKFSCTNIKNSVEYGENMKSGAQRVQKALQGM